MSPLFVRGRPVLQMLYEPAAHPQFNIATSELTFAASGICLLKVKKKEKKKHASSAFTK